jgi:hypothetical protein
LGKTGSEQRAVKVTRLTPNGRSGSSSAEFAAARPIQGLF